MAQVTWEIDSEDSDIDKEDGESLESQALKHAKHISDTNFKPDDESVFTVELDCGTAFVVDLRNDLVQKI